jgi:Tol biopolymer transport system component
MSERTGRAGVWRPSFVCVSLVALLSLPTLTTPAGATYPGANGKIAFVRDGNVWKMDPDGTHKRQLTFLSGAETAGAPRWSPDGTRIAYQACRTYSGTLNCDIWTMRADGSGKTRITRHVARDDQPTWSPNGVWIAFTTNRDYLATDVPSSNIYRIRATAPFGKAIGPVEEDCSTFPTCGEPGYEYFWDAEPDWAPDGSTIAFTRVSSFGCGCYDLEYEVRVVPVWTGAPSTIVTHDWDPSWSPGGRRIAVARWGWNGGSSDGPDVSNIVHVASDGTGLKEVTHFGVWSYRFAEDPAWAPSDGRTIVYTLFVSGGKVSVFRVAANGITPPVRIAWNASDPDWQPRPT